MVTPKKIIIQDLELADKEIKRLREENRNLKEYLNASFKREESIRLDYESSLLKIKDLEEENRKLEERIRFLEQCLDNKEKVNKSLREELKELNNMMLFETKIEK